MNFDHSYIFPTTNIFYLNKNEVIVSQLRVKCHCCHREINETQCSEKGGVLSICGRFLHEECFACVSCKIHLLQPHRIPFRFSNETLMCLDCFQIAFHPKCTGCGCVVRERGYVAMNNLWHRQCFRCARCQQVMPGLDFNDVNGVPFCTDCSFIIQLEATIPPKE
ncbi:unnamed protein product, partial [Mesorhabditis belari]|uniref:LIM zinc-binding domain-containing protein n=1 Tax=Mesorhabditis belari TaxID=2138241 RepID=A0AAF3FKH9_9BILA